MLHDVDTRRILVCRAVPPSELDRAMAVTVTDPVGWHDRAKYRRDLAERRCRPEWSWIAEADGRIVARALWWGFPDGERPLALECLHVDESQPDRAEVAATLLAAGLAAVAGTDDAGAPPYSVFLSNGWRNDPTAVDAVRWRGEAAGRIGLIDQLERIRFQWSPLVGLPAVSGRLTLTPEPDDEAFVDVFQRVAEGSLDRETRRGVATLGPERAARRELDFYRSMPGERSWWRVARTADGRLAGMAIPSRNAYGPNVGYLGVVPELRGRGYVHDLLAEITRFHAQAGAQTVTATTDVTNAPMAAAFTAAGYQPTESRLIFSAPPR
jgi:RimJ/RimL family protein N-acetyltransferase